MQHSNLKCCAYVPMRHGYARSAKYRNLDQNHSQNHLLANQLALGLFVVKWLTTPLFHCLV